MVSVSLDVADVFRPFQGPSRYKAIHGGRGSGKSHFLAERLVFDSLTQPGLRSVCIREVQKSLKESAKRLLEDKLRKLGLGEADGFKVLEQEIRTPGGGVIVFQGMQDHTAESIKSLEGFGRAWVEEAQSLSPRSLSLLRPTIRAEGSELWFSWNPRRKTDPVDEMFRAKERPTGAVVIEANWNDNPWFPSVLEQERQDCLKNEPEQYGHIWEGEYATVLSGAYYARHLTEARQQGRVRALALDPLMQIYAFWDIGVSDATSIWIAQFIGAEIHVLDYYEASGQPLAAHLNWLRSNGYSAAQCVLPHDASQHDAYSAVRFQDHIRSAGFRTKTIPNQGKGAALKRVETARRLFPKIVFANTKNVETGLEAIGWYHERKDEARGVGLGPEHDWSSHAADSFGLMCIAYEPPRTTGNPWGGMSEPIMDAFA